MVVFRLAVNETIIQYAIDIAHRAG